MFFLKIVRRFLDILYPPHCCICQKPLDDTTFICEECSSGFQSIDTIAHCQYCYYPFSALASDQLVEDCFNCRDSSFVFQNNYSVFLFEGNIKELVYKYKFHGQDFLADVMASHMVSFCLKNIEGDFDILTFVPLDKKRYSDRGYNQAELLAKKIAKSLGHGRVVSALKQIRGKDVQSSLSRGERYRNVKGAFSVSAVKPICNARVLLIDDVCTTGATLNECSKVLLAKGAKEVITLSFARAVLD